MFKFIVKGLWRDSSRSRFPVIMVSVGVFLVVFMYCFLMGVIDDMVSVTAKMDSGHFKVMTRAYEKISHVLPNDLAILGADELQLKLEEDHPDIVWTPRIRFGGLLDIPDEEGETRLQVPVAGLGIDLLSPGSIELSNYNFSDTSVISGRLPQKASEILISKEMAKNAAISLGDQVTLVSSTMYGGMSIMNFTVSGTVNFGFAAMDKGAMIVDIEGARQALDMEDATGELVGFYKDMDFLGRAEESDMIKAQFNAEYSDENDEFSPYMITFLDQNSMRDMVNMMDSAIYGMIFLFVLVMFIVLWNSGLLNGIRRYGEIGLRLAIGEEKKHLIRSMLLESVVIGAVGSLFGTGVGLLISYYFQEVGLDISYMMDSVSIMLPNVMRASIKPTSFYIGFIPGIFATFFGTLMASRGIKKRETAQLFKELEV